MISLSNTDISKIIQLSNDSAEDSNLGFFSKPFRINYNNQELILKRYVSLTNEKILLRILENHDLYIHEMRKIGIKIPPTFATLYSENKYKSIVIVQKAYPKELLFRTVFEQADSDKLHLLIKKIYDQVFLFWNNKKNLDIGFHPTFRNFCYIDDQLIYFDTFPPMLMNKKEINKIIIQMSPFGKLIKPLIPLNTMNLVSDEYYDLAKMFTGITGSACRLRTDEKHHLLNFSKEYIGNLNLNTENKTKILQKLNEPPKLSVLWTTVRKLSGNVGKPNIK